MGLCRAAGPVVARDVLRHFCDIRDHHKCNFSNTHHNIEHYGHNHNYAHDHLDHGNNDVCYNHNYGYNNHHPCRTDHAHR